MTDYNATDFTKPGRYRVWYGRTHAPTGPFADDAVELYADDEYPGDGYIVDVDESGGVTSVPSLPGRFT